ncbi:TetR/AcrR family transcriptional regulator [Actinokineospora auranticolor]|uniref:AcrR family transcriptional regulator n=1 Tax=Actinokineospora auranticolor TaxID=155976 RepID=A0A2S6GFD1_9PSEU|nr:TetR/AcrR family transcriptional regulator [Actinokineospora auranticolor]PPK63929.1 AcrR family transcriptional regulator [Actinokineospora auranticolor]
MTEARVDGRVQRGNHTRGLILARAVEIASVEGLASLSLGRLSTDLHLSKSGVFGLFGSKEELQLATIDAATKIYIDTVVVPVMDLSPGLAKVWRLCVSWLDYSRGRVFPGGCFFYAVAAEFDAQPGRVRETIVALSARWARLVEKLIDQARAVGEIKEEVETAQLGFELVAFMETANAYSVLNDDVSVYRRSRTAIRSLLRHAASDPALVPQD